MDKLQDPGGHVSVSSEYLANLERDLRRSEARLGVAIEYIKQRYGQGRLPVELVTDLSAAELSADVKSETLLNPDLHDQLGDTESCLGEHWSINAVATTTFAGAPEFAETVQIEMDTAVIPPHLSETDSMDVDRTTPNLEAKDDRHPSNNPSSPSSLMNPGQLRIVNIRSITEPPENEDDEDEEVKISAFQPRRHSTRKTKHQVITSPSPLQLVKPECVIPSKHSSCKECRYNARSMIGLERHMRRKHPAPAEPKPKRSCKCKVCNVSFESAEDLNKHIMEVHVESRKRAKKQPLVPRVTPIPILATPAKQIFKCGKCPSSFKSRIRLNAHIGSAHSVEAKTKPALLSRRSKTLTAKVKDEPLTATNTEVMTYQMNPADFLISTQPDPLSVPAHKCVTCGTIFDLKTKLNIHRKCEHGDQSFFCEICGFVATSEGRLNYHRRWSHPPPEPCAKSDFKCTNCGDYYKSEQDLKIHVLEELHSTTHRCRACGKLFESLLELRMHRQTAHPVSVPVVVQPTHIGTDTPPLLQPLIFRCQALGCGFRFPSRGELNLHRKNVHNIRSYPCLTCEFMGKNERDVSIHTRKMHPDPSARPFKCQHCPLDFKSREQFQRHLKRHLGLDLKKCPHCGVMKNGTDMYNHITIVHKGRKFKCGICASMFSLRAHLKNHYVLKHADEPMPALTDFEVIYTGDSGKGTFSVNEDSGDTNEEASAVVSKRRKVSTKKSTTRKINKRTVNDLKCSTCDVRLHTKDDFELHMMRHAKDPEYKLKHRLPVKRIGVQHLSASTKKETRKSEVTARTDNGDELDFDHFLKPLF